MTDITTVNGLSTTCTYCLSPQQTVDLSLMLYGPERTALAQKLPISMGHHGGILYDHWQHLTRALLLPRVQVPPPPEDADELVKVRWLERRLFELIYSADDTPAIDRTDTKQVFQAISQKNNIAANLRDTIRLEAELKGSIERAKLRARRHHEVDAAQEEEMLPRAMRIQIAKADLRREGYRVEKIADSDEIVVDKETDDGPTDD